MSQFKERGVRCDWCGNFSSNQSGEYTKPDGVSCGYIRQAFHGAEDNGSDICEECKADQCPKCGGDSVVRMTPSTPGPTGWGGRCEACGHHWQLQEIEHGSQENQRDSASLTQRLEKKIDEMGQE